MGSGRSRATSRADRRHACRTRQARLGKAVCHELCVRDADAEPERAHSARIPKLLLDLLKDKTNPGVIAGVDPLKCLDVVAPSRPLHRRQVGLVVEAEVLEWAQQTTFEGIPEPQFNGDVVVEVM